MRLFILLLFLLAGKIFADERNLWLNKAFQLSPEMRWEKQQPVKIFAEEEEYVSLAILKARVPQVRVLNKPEGILERWAYDEAIEFRREPLALEWSNTGVKMAGRADDFWYILKKEDVVSSGKVRAEEALQLCIHTPSIFELWNQRGFLRGGVNTLEVLDVKKLWAEEDEVLLRISSYEGMSSGVVSLLKFNQQLKVISAPEEKSAAVFSGKSEGYKILHEAELNSSGSGYYYALEFSWKGASSVFRLLTQRGMREVYLNGERLDLNAPFLESSRLRIGKNSLVWHWPELMKGLWKPVELSFFSSSWKKMKVSQEKPFLLRQMESDILLVFDDEGKIIANAYGPELNAGADLRQYAGREVHLCFLDSSVKQRQGAGVREVSVPGWIVPVVCEKEKKRLQLPQPYYQQSLLIGGCSYFGRGSEIQLEWTSPKGVVRDLNAGYGLSWLQMPAVEGVALGETVVMKGEGVRLPLYRLGEKLTSEPFKVSWKKTKQTKKSVAVVRITEKFSEGFLTEKDSKVDGGIYAVRDEGELLFRSYIYRLRSYLWALTEGKSCHFSFAEFDSGRLVNEQLMKSFILNEEAAGRLIDWHVDSKEQFLQRFGKDLKKAAQLQVDTVRRIIREQINEIAPGSKEVQP